MKNVGESKIKAIIFDCFGVLTSEAWLVFRAKYFASLPELDEKAVELNRQLDAGIISEPDFDSEIARLVDRDVAFVSHELHDGHKPNDELFDYVRDELKPHYKIGLLSNVSHDVTIHIFRPEQNALFDAKVLSFELGVTKPHPAMYQTIAIRLDVEPSECIFIDDRELFVQGAREVGMTGVQYVDNTQIRRALDEMLH